MSRLGVILLPLPLLLAGCIIESYEECGGGAAVGGDWCGSCCFSAGSCWSNGCSSCGTQGGECATGCASCPEGSCEEWDGGTGEWDGGTDDQDDWSDDWDDSSWNDDDEGADDGRGPAPEPYFSGCTDDRGCRAGEVCDAQYMCVPVVADCPATPECLGDPEHADAPYWEGIDPTYVGTVRGPGLAGRVQLDVDFYEDHLYGEGLMRLEILEGSLLREDWLLFVITGVRQEQELFGQLLDASGQRTFDAVFEATLIDGSEIVGEWRVDSDEGRQEGELRLLRVSACGCEVVPPPPPPECTADGDCAVGLRCVDGTCQEVGGGGCRRAEDCGTGEACYDGECRRSCRESGECGRDEQCQYGVCLPAAPPEAVPCADDCDCDRAAGERCLEGFCRLP